MTRILKKLLGGLIFAAAAFLFVVFTASINEPQSMGGPMNMMSPSSEEWFLIVLVVDALFLLIALGGIKLLGLSRRAVGMLSLVVGIIILVLGIQNHIHTPPPDSLRDTDLIPVPTFLHYVVYIFVGICLFVGAWLIARPIRKRHKAM